MATWAPSAAPIAALSAGCGVAPNGAFSGNSWVYGVILAVLAALSNNVGVNMQKLAWTKKQLKLARGPVYRLIWLAGLLGVILASVFDFVALFFAPQSVIAPLGALTMVSNVCVASWMHGEVSQRITLVATFIIVAGCVLSVAMASHVNSICPPNALFQLYFAPLFLGYVAVLIAIIVGVWLFVRRAEWALKQFGPDDLAYRRYYKMHRISYAFVAGLFGAQSVLFTRSFNQLIIDTTAGGRNLFTYPQTWGIIIGLVGSIVLQLYWLNHGLARFESTYNVPVFTTAFIIDVVLGGGFLYGEFGDFTLLQAILFPVGIFLCVFGVIVLICAGSHPSDVEEGVYDYDDEAPLPQIKEDDVIVDEVAIVSPVHKPAVVAGAVGAAGTPTSDGSGRKSDLGATPRHAEKRTSKLGVEPRGSGLGLGHGNPINRVSQRISLVIDDLIDELSPRTAPHHGPSPRGTAGGKTGGLSGHGSAHGSFKSTSVRTSFSMLPHTTLIIAGASEPRLSARHAHMGNRTSGLRTGATPKNTRRASHSHDAVSDMAEHRKTMPRVQSLTVFRSGSELREEEQPTTVVVSTPPIRPSAPPVELVEKMHLHLGPSPIKESPNDEGDEEPDY